MSLEAMPIVDAKLDYDAHFLTITQADLLLEQLLAELPWRHDEITVYGKSHLMPRLHCYQSAQNLHYQYSNLTLQSEPFHPKVLQLKRYIEAVSGFKFNAVLINLYRDGADKMGWHSDDEAALGTQPCIASISLGAMRSFKLRHRQKLASDISLELTHGSLLLMHGEMQGHWQHSLPVRKKVSQARINLTFRHIING
ncbi:MAG: alpha-ketoglutarate-dependent dioxygenase AlkB [Oceanospirillaceae bacterium]|nr:alpha-ketoglutarate-dependent dioxygenase AlkB [Oceanospirillaceae bacterium]